jgi:UDP-N-acetyl-D-mannosaminuronate dehydrogenase
VEKNKQVVIAGLGEVGKPLYQLIARHRDTKGVDVGTSLDGIGQVEVLHICFPFQVRDFVGEVARYTEQFKPELIVINSTVAVGTTRAVAERTGAPTVNSPIRGKHARMGEELQKYTKFVGCSDPAAGQHAVRHFESIGLKTKLLTPPEATELAKLTETTYFGLMIAWAQEVERYCDRCGANYEEIISFYDEIKFFPQVKYFPGIIGGHCVMPNIEILRKFDDSIILQAIEASNQMKLERESRKQEAEFSVDQVPVQTPA